MKILIFTILISLSCSFITFNYYYPVISEVIYILKEASSKNDNTQKINTLYSIQPESIKKLIQFQKSQNNILIKKLKNFKFVLKNDSFVILNAPKAILLNNFQDNSIPNMAGNNIYLDYQYPIHTFSIKAGEEMEIKNIFIETDYTNNIDSNGVIVQLKVREQLINLSFNDFNKLYYERKFSELKIINPVTLCERLPGPPWSVEHRLLKYKLTSQFALKTFDHSQFQDFYIRNENEKSRICMDFYLENLDQLVFINLNKNMIINNSELQI